MDEMVTISGQEYNDYYRPRTERDGDFRRTGIYSNDTQRPRMKIETVEGLRYNDYQRLRMKIETIEGHEYNECHRPRTEQIEDRD